MHSFHIAASALRHTRPALKRAEESFVTTSSDGRPRVRWSPSVTHYRPDGSCFIAVHGRRKRPATHWGGVWLHAMLPQ